MRKFSLDQFFGTKKPRSLRSTNLGYPPGQLPVEDVRIKQRDEMKLNEQINQEIWTTSQPGSRFSTNLGYKVGEKLPQEKKLMLIS
jgi:hypothetical protein